MTANQTFEMSVQKIDAIEGCVVLRPKGEINIDNSGSFMKQVMNVLEGGFSKLIFDCAEVPYMSSTAIGLLPHFLKEAKARKGNLAMANLQPRVRDVIQLLGLTLFLNTMETLQQARAFISSSDDSAPVFPKIFACAVCGHRIKVGRSGWFRCSECKTLLQVSPAGKVLPGYAQEENDFELIPEKTEQAIRLLGDLSSIVRKAPLAQDQRAAFKKTIGRIVLNLYQREVKDVWAELEEVRT